MKLFKMTATAALLGVATSASAQLTLVSAWDLNEGSGNTFTQYELSEEGAGYEWNQVGNDSATFSNTTSATLSGQTWTPTSGAPNSTASLTLDGTGGENEFDTNVSGNALAGTGAKTFVAWINPTAGNGSILSYSPNHGTGSGDDLRFLIDDNGLLRAEVSSGFFRYDTKDFRNDGWNMVAAIFDTDTATSSFYIGGTGIVAATSNDPNDRAIDTGAAGSGTSGDSLESDNFVIGTDPASRGFTGGLDMIAAYNGAASLAELDAIYANGIAIPEPGTLALVGLALGAMLVFRRRR